MRALVLPSVSLVPLTPQIAADAYQLAEFHGDPADRMLVATARSLACALVTKDRAIREWGGVPAIW